MKDARPMFNQELIDLHNTIDRLARLMHDEAKRKEARRLAREAKP